MSDQFTEVTTQGWGSRLLESIKAVAVGLLLFLVSFPALFWNEGRAVQTARSNKEGAATVVSVPADKVNPANEGKLVHVTGTPVTDETLTDDLLGVTGKGLELRRTVEMFQWAETKISDTKKKLGGGTETVTTYKYETRWSEARTDSATFKEKSGHENPTMALSSGKVSARSVLLGGFQVPPNLAAQMGKPEPVPADDKALAALPVDLRARARVADGGLYVGQNAASPVVGDLRIKLSVLTPTVVSVVAQQSGSTFAAYQTKAGDKLQMVEQGTKSSAEMFKEAQGTNAALTWAIRGFGFFIMFIGILLVFRPLVTVADVVPIFGSILGFGAGLVSFLVSVVLSSITIAIAWIVYRPLVGIALLAVAGLGVFAMIRLKRRNLVAAAPG